MKANYILAVLIVSIVFLACSGDKPAKKATPAKLKTEIKQKVKREISESKTEKKAAEKKEAEEEASEPIPQEQLDKAKKLIKAVGNVSDIDAKKIFKINCTICHGLKGNMKINGAKDLTKSKINLTNAVAQVYFGKGLMTPYNNILSDEEIVAVAKYSETLRK